MADPKKNQQAGNAPAPTPNLGAPEAGSRSEDTGPAGDAPKRAARGPADDADRQLAGSAGFGRHPEDEALWAAREKLERLRRSNELKLIEAEIEKLEHGGLGPAQIQAKKKAEKLREATHKELVDGKQVAKYRIPEKSFKGGQLREPGYIVTLPVDTLPSATWEAVAKVPPRRATEFAPIDEE